MKPRAHSYAYLRRSPIVFDEAYSQESVVRIVASVKPLQILIHFHSCNLFL